MICFTLSADTLEGVSAQVNRYRGCFDILELRLDLLRQDERERLVHDTASPAWAIGVPLILTFRRLSDGGAWNGDDTERLNYLSALVEQHAEGLVGEGLFLDLEDDVVAHDAGRKAADVAARYGGEIIRSRHVFDRTPEDPVAVLRELAGCGDPGEIPKLAVQVRGSRDLVRLVRAAIAWLDGMDAGDAGAGGAGEARDKRAIIVGMGAYGFPTRVLAPRIGSFLSYSSEPSKGREHVAPGQIDPRSMAELYRYRSLGPTTEVFGIIGNPVLHSRSPAFHNAEFDRKGRNAVYVPFPTDDVPAFRELMALLHIRGVSVTIPHKEMVADWFRAAGAEGASRAVGTAGDPGADVPAVGEASTELLAVGACNTVIRDADGRLVGANTDVAGFLEPLRSRVPELRDRGVTVIGAGGAARAVVYGLLSSGARVLVLNRTLHRAESLAGEYAKLGQVTAGALEPGSLPALRLHNDILVQTTSVGMQPDTDADPLAFYEFAGTEVLYEIIYTPPVTRLVARAKEAGCLVIGGEEMFLAQAKLQSDLFAQT